MRLVGDEGIDLQHCVQSLAGRARSVPGVGKLVEVAGDLPFVPGEQDRFDVPEVLGSAGNDVSSASHQIADPSAASASRR
jgi:hypothetical protein